MLTLSSSATWTLLSLPPPGTLSTSAVVSPREPMRSSRRSPRSLEGGFIAERKDVFDILGTSATFCLAISDIVKE